MSQPRRRRRNRRRKPSGANRQTKRDAVEQSRGSGEEEGSQERTSRSRRSGRGRRGRTRGRDAGTASPKSSEDLVRGDPKRPPAQLTRQPDGTTLEQVIGELQSSWGVPQHPQEYRITLKVAEERSERAQVTEERADPPDVDPGAADGDKPRREKAPAAPRIGGSAAEAEGPTASKTSKRRRARKRRKRAKGSGGG